jgi:hypothetical protein
MLYIVVRREGITPITKTRTMTTQPISLVEKVVNRMKQIEPACGAYASGGRIKGCYRGKASESYSYMLTAREYEYNNTRTTHVRRALEQAISEIYA